MTEPTSIDSGRPSENAVGGSKSARGFRKSARTTPAPAAAMAQAANPAATKNSRRERIRSLFPSSASDTGRLADQELLHGDGPRRAALGTEAAANTDGLVLDQRG